MSIELSMIKLLVIRIFKRTILFDSARLPIIPEVVTHENAPVEMLQIS
ncbi:hypothetical protein SAMN04488057_11499 [Cyclobacterium lianum]|uniref:Uncharacterized protein n=1 Tax=Cyclobacterium lianum TaxID=388280 RepID=A0A1M7Q6N1_9BACT|nr:hypothetical protein SAMN04488057_11499 [Cyclobacterium lianum]